MIALYNHDGVSEIGLVRPIITQWLKGLFNVMHGHVDADLFRVMLFPSY